MINWGERNYTSIIIDLIDTYNQGEMDINYPFDRVSGYTISDIESVLSNSGRLLELKENLKNNFENPSEIFLDELFDQYISFTR